MKDASEHHDATHFDREGRLCEDRWLPDRVCTSGLVVCDRCSAGPKSFTYEFDRIFVEGWFWWMVFSYVLLLHLITFLSLFVKWGAIPLCIGIMFFSNMICISTMQYFVIRMGKWGISSDDEKFAVICFLELFATLMLHFGIGVRLRSIAAR